MTKNRALKRAARERASRTGETYVVARRNAMNGAAAPAAVTLGPLTGTLHRWTHLVPGVPEHREATVARTARRNAAHDRHANPARVHAPHPVREKRVLRGWQEWIESRVTK